LSGPATVTGNKPASCHWTVYRSGKAQGRMNRKPGYLPVNLSSPKGNVEG